MAEARDRAAWNRTFALEAVLFNAFRGKDDEPVDPMQFYPWPLPPKREKPAKRLTPELDRMLSAIYPPKQ